MDKVLLIQNLENKTKDMSTYLSQKYDVQTINMPLRETLRYIMNNTPDVIITYMTEDSNLELDMGDLKEIREKYDGLMIAVGSKDSFRSKNQNQGKKDIDSLLNELEGEVTVSNYVKEEKEEGASIKDAEDSSQEPAKEIHQFITPVHIVKILTLADEYLGYGDSVVELGEKKQVLLVDDDSRMLRALRLCLIDNYNVSMANSGMDALSFLLKEKPDLILMKYEMTGYDGVKTLEIIRGRKSVSTVPVMLFSNLSERELVMKCLSLNIQGYLLMPIKKDKLQKTLESFFEQQLYF